MIEKLKSDRLWALLLYALVVIANAFFNLGLEVVPDGQELSPLLMLGGTTMTFIFGKSWRSSVPEGALEAGTKLGSEIGDRAEAAREAANE